ASAAQYADKAIAILESGLHDLQKDNETTRQFLARGDGSTKTFTLANADLIASSLGIFLAPVSTIQVQRGATGTSDAVAYYRTFLKVSNTSDGNADYQQGTDWHHSGDLPNNLIDWTGAAHAPAVGASYYVTAASSLDGSPTTSYTLSGNTITFTT